MKGLDLKEPFRKLPSQCLYFGGVGSKRTPFILQMMNETSKSHVFVFAVVSWVKITHPLACPQLLTCTS